VVPFSIIKTQQGGPLLGYQKHLVAEEMEVIRTPVREALRGLESEGFVEIRPHHGAYVATVAPEDVQEIYEVRALIEPETVRQVTPAIPDAVLDQLEESLVLQRDFSWYDTLQ
jgi:DNA-binding GntR family transcriptional regulator